MSTALRCPRLFHFRYVDKLPEPEVMPEARIGKAIHVALEHALQGTPPADAAAKARADLTDEHELHRYDALLDALLPAHEAPGHGDEFMVLADFDAYADCHRRVEHAYRDQDGWARMVVRNIAKMGYFSSDRSVREYAAVRCTVNGPV